MDITAVVTIVALAIVAIILFLGLWNMFKGGENSANRSQMLMRWRVGLQFLALVIIMTGLYLTTR